MHENETKALLDLLGATRLAASRLDPETPWGIATREIANELAESLPSRALQPQPLSRTLPPPDVAAQG